MTKRKTITLAEYPSLWGGEQDFERFGRAFSHPFLIVKDSNGDVIEEIHGRWQNTFRTRQFIDLCEQYENECAGRPVTLPALYPMAVVSACGPRDTVKATVSTIFFEGSTEEVEYYISTLKHSVTIVNDAKTPFYRYAVPGTGFGNCQMSLGIAIGMTPDFPPVPDLTLACTGWTAFPKIGIRQTL